MQKISIIKIIFIFIFLVFIFNAKQPTSIELNFSIGAKQYINNNVFNIIPIDDNTILKENDGIRIFFQPADDCYIYTFFYDSNNIMTLLFPDDYNYYKKNSALKGIKYFLPDPWDWYLLDNNPGIETIYFIASTSRLTDIEKLIKKLDDKNPDTVKMASNNIRDNIKEKITQQLTKNYNFQERNAFEIAGVIRAVNNDIEKYTKGLVGENIIIKSIRFKHEKK